LFSGIMDMIDSAFTMLSMLNSVAEGDLMSVCTGLVDKLQSQGTSRCDVGALCGATGLLAEECDAIMMGICVLSDDVPNPCAWLMDQVTGGNSNICQTIADELHVAGESSSSGGGGGGGNDSCRYAHDGECDEPNYCSSGTDCSDCHSCSSSSSGDDSCRYSHDGECDVPQFCSRGKVSD
jgi:hypothetical protein